MPSIDAPSARHVRTAPSAPNSFTRLSTSSHHPLAKPPLRPLGPPPQMSCSRIVMPRRGFLRMSWYAVHMPVKPPPTTTTSAFASAVSGGHCAGSCSAFSASRSHQLRCAPGVSAWSVRLRPSSDMVDELVLCRAMTDAVVELEKVTKVFGGVVAVDHLDLEIRRGEFFSMLGPSGCGKTTTLRIIGGFEEPSEGVVKLAGRDITDMPAFKRDINTVFQSYGLFPHLSVFENIAFGLRRKHVDAKEIQRRVGDALELVNLGKLGRRRPSQLSGGQQQRVALARALVNRPTVLLLDEPLGALDLKLRKQMQLELKRIQDEVGITFIFVTHDQEEAMTISDRIAVMNRGRIEQLGTPDVVYERPASVFVAEFLGASNLLHGKYAGVENGWGVVELDTGKRLLVNADPELAVAEQVKVGVRPEKITVHPRAQPVEPGVNRLEATLTSAVFVGVSYQYFFATKEGGGLSAFDRNAGGGPVAAQGEAVSLAWRPEHTFVIPVGTGEAQPAAEAPLVGERA